jgi:hypothetical protein
MQRETGSDMASEEAAAIVPLIQKKTDAVSRVEPQLITNPILPNREGLRSVIAPNPAGTILLGAGKTHPPIQSPVIQVGRLNTYAHIETRINTGITFRIAMHQMERPQRIQIKPATRVIRGSVPTSIRIRLGRRDNGSSQ